jgi:hypothetical protein
MRTVRKSKVSSMKGVAAEIDDEIYIALSAKAVQDGVRLQDVLRKALTALAKDGKRSA